MRRCANGTYLDCDGQSGAMGWGMFRQGLLILVEVPRLAGARTWLLCCHDTMHAPLCQQRA
jgi:hypothetical protein